MLVLFFASRRRHTMFDCDWSSDVCSSDLSVLARAAVSAPAPVAAPAPAAALATAAVARSEERRVGKECRSGGPAEYEKRNIWLRTGRPCAGPFSVAAYLRSRNPR